MVLAERRGSIEHLGLEADGAVRRRATEWFPTAAARKHDDIVQSSRAGKRPELPRKRRRGGDRGGNLLGMRRVVQTQLVDNAMQGWDDHRCRGEQSDHGAVMFVMRSGFLAS